MSQHENDLNDDKEDHVKPWHKEAGFVALGERQQEAVELALMLMMDALRVLGPGAMYRPVLREAEFRVYELQRRSPTYRAAYLARNDSCGDIK